jgi:hypothetical protein
MRKIITIALALGLALPLVVCDKSGDGGGSAAATTSGGGQRLITVDKETAVSSEARDYYYADTSREEFAFDKKGTLTGYKKIYTFVDGADKEKALEYITQGGFKASIEGNTLVVDGDGNYAGFPYDSSNFNEIKERLDGKNTQYTVK